MAKVPEIKCYCAFILILLILVCDCESKRGYGSGRRGGHTTPRSKHTTHNSNYYYHTTQSSIGFENFQRPQNSPLPTNHHNPQQPSPGIGFENVQTRAPLNNQPHGNTNPSAPQLPPNHHNPQPPSPGIGFENVQNRVPPNNPTYHQNTHNPNAPPYQNQHPNYNGYGHQQPGYNQYPHNPQYGYQPPPNYYNPHYTSPGGIPPPIYQPVQQSTGGSLLGYAGTFAGGFLIGKLASGGFGNNGGNNGNGGNGGEYTVHHYHHNADTVPKQVSVTSNGLVICSQNQTQGLCVPNTFPFCLSNGTIMCVTHLAYTTPCNTNNSLPCVVTVLPCSSNDTSCNNSISANVTTTALYIPCISKMTVTQLTSINFTTDNSISNQPGSVSTVEYCITAIAEPKKIPSPVPSFFDFVKQFVSSTYQMAMNNNTYMNNSTVITSSDAQNKTEITTLLPITNIGNKTEITTLPYNT